MAKKKFNLKFIYDAPVTLTYAILAVTIFILYVTVLKDKMDASIFIAPTNGKGTLPFSFSNVPSYFRLFFHILGFTDQSVLISDLIFILLLGPQMEEKYGSVVIGIMIFVSALFAGVLNACFCANPACGAGAPVFMLIVLYALSFLTKKTISATSIAILLLFIVRSFVLVNPNGVVGVIITIAGGVCGSLLALLSSPKSRKERKEGVRISKKEFEVSSAKQKKSDAKKTDKKPVIIKPEVEKSSSSDETVVGTIKF